MELFWVFCLLAVGFVIPAAPKKFSSYCYYTNWAKIRPYPYSYYAWDIDPWLCTHIAYSFVTLRSDFTVRAGYADKTVFDYLRGKRGSNPELKLIIAVGGWNAGSGKFSKMAATQKTRKVFVDSCIALVNEAQFDGVEIDWEYPANREGSLPEDKENFVLLLKELKEATSLLEKLVTTAVSAVQFVSEKAYDIPGIYSHVDLVNIMTYDYMHTHQEDLTYGAPLYADPSTPKHESVNSTWTWFKERGAIANKTLIGIPLYGRSYTLEDSNHTSVGDIASSRGPVGKITKEKGMLASYEICALKNRPGANNTYIPECATSVLIVDNIWVSYDEERSMKSKIDWIASNELAGAMIWALDFDLLTRHSNACPEVISNYQYLAYIKKRFVAHSKGTTSDDDTESVPGSKASGTDTAVDSEVSEEQPFSTYCYFTNWAQYRPYPYSYYARDIDPWICTHIAYSFVTLSSDFKLSPTSDDTAIFGHLRGKRKSSPSLKLLIAVGGWNAGSEIFSKMAATRKTRKVFVDSCIALVNQAQFDGVEIDWEYPANRNGSSPEDKHNFVLLLIELKVAAEESGKLVTVAVSSGLYISEKAYDIPGIYRNVDLVNIMTYDYQSGRQGQQLTYGAPLYASDQESVASTWAWFEERGAVANKTLIGIPLYGRSYTLEDSNHISVGDEASGTGPPGKITKEPGLLSAYEICALRQQPTVNNTYIAEAATSVLVVDNLWVSYDEETSIDRKIEWVARNRLAGSTVWAMDFDLLARHNMCPGTTSNYKYIAYIKDRFKYWANELTTTTSTTSTTVTTTTAVQTTTRPTTPSNDSTLTVTASPVEGQDLNDSMDTGSDNSTENNYAGEIDSDVDVGIFTSGSADIPFALSSSADIVGLASARNTADGGLVGSSMQTTILPSGSTKILQEIDGLIADVATALIDSSEVVNDEPDGEVVSDSTSEFVTMMTQQEVLEDTERISVFEAVQSSQAVIVDMDIKTTVISSSHDTSYDVSHDATSYDVSYDASNDVSYGASASSADYSDTVDSEPATPALLGIGIQKSEDGRVAVGELQVQKATPNYVQPPDIMYDHSGYVSASVCVSFNPTLLIWIGMLYVMFRFYD